MAGSDLTILVALAAGLLSFLSPCVLPLVPGYLGQLTVVAVASRGDGRDPGRWVAVRHALAYVSGFGLVFTLLGLTATFVGGPLAGALPALRQVGGLVLIVMGLNLAGILTLPALERLVQRVWRPLEAGAAGSLASAGGTVALGSPGGGIGDRIGGRLVAARGGWVASFGLGVIFAVGWTPCIGVILGSVLTLAAESGQALQGGVLLLAYTAGLGIPFLVLGALYDRAPAIVHPLVRHGRIVALIGGLLVVAVGVAMLMDWLVLLPRYIPINAGV